MRDFSHATCHQPLARKGIEVVGIDTSEAMVAKLRAKPDGADIAVEIGDFSKTSAEGQLSVVFLVFTNNNLTTQASQVA